MRYLSPWIFTTNRCNLRCSYCYIKKYSGDMQDNIYKKINKSFLSLLNNDKIDKVIYRLAGGEPLLVFNKWKNHIESFLKNRGSYVCLITNLTLLNKEIKEYILKNNIGLCISLDSLEYSKPYKNGKSSSKVVSNNIDLLLNNVRENIDISTVINKNSFNDIENLARYIAERKTLSWSIYLDHYFCGEISNDIIIKKLEKVINILINSKYNIYKNFHFNNITFDTEYEGCTAGKKLLAIDIKGNIYPCQTAKQSIGIINSNLLETLKNQTKYNLGYNYELPSDCKKCSINDICNGACKLNQKEINRKYSCYIIKNVLLYLGKNILRGVKYA